jgi:hypothetical protein
LDHDHRLEVLPGAAQLQTLSKTAPLLTKTGCGMNHHKRACNGIRQLRYAQQLKQATTLFREFSVGIRHQPHSLLDAKLKVCQANTHAQESWPLMQPCGALEPPKKQWAAHTWQQRRLATLTETP